MAPQYGSLPFKEAIDYFNQKLPLPTTGWQDVYGAQHDHAMMVAGANKVAMVESFANALQAAIEGGDTLADFRKRFDEIVLKNGWDYHGSRGWRSRLIYETNIRQAYNAGREAQMADPAFQERFPYTEYRHSGAENFRPEHKKRPCLVGKNYWEAKLELQHLHYSVGGRQLEYCHCLGVRHLLHPYPRHLCPSYQSFPRAHTEFDFVAAWLLHPKVHLD